MTEELPEVEIEVAEAVGSTTHSHELVSSENATLTEHLRREHALDPPATASRSTLEGLHDRLHDQRHASDT